MSASWQGEALQALVWIGNVFFFGRFLVQWWLSERAGQSVAPPIFWWMSLAGSAALAAYSLHLPAYVLFAGYLLNGAIYARNLTFQRSARHGLSTATATALGLAGLLVLVGAGVFEQYRHHDPSLAWIVCAVAGQAIWTSRFVVQWWLSERAERSHFPQAFWWLSLAGNALLLAYTIHLGELGLIAGFVVNPLVQIRNLMLGRHKPREVAG
jgi:lipid-A-disaccharide synthase-like uncharacterized protein